MMIITKKVIQKMNTKQKTINIINIMKKAKVKALIATDTEVKKEI